MNHVPEALASYTAAASFLAALPPIQLTDYGLGRQKRMARAPASV